MERGALSVASAGAKLSLLSGVIEEGASRPLLSQQRGVHMNRLRSLTFVIILVISSAAASAQLHVRARPAGNAKPAAAGQMVTLPYTVNDSAGNQWLIYQGGWIQQRSNPPVFSQSAMLQLNNNGVSNNNNQARLDEHTGEVVFDNMAVNVPSLTVTRRILVDQNESYVRYIDILKNSGQQDQSVNYMLQSNLNFGLTGSQFITEPGGKQRQLGWAAATQAGRSAVELFAGRGGKTIPQLNYQQGSNFIQAQMQVTIPAGKQIAIMHLHATCATPDAGIQQMTSLREARLLAGVSGELRRQIINFSGGGGYVGD
ncbi:MAG: hypothetical protein ACHP79_19230, partial [Terriglobales bacterium]